MRRAAFYIVILLVLLFPSTNRLAAQDDNFWLYDVVSLEDSYELIRTDVIDGHSEHILSVPKTVPVSLTSIIPASEVEAAHELFEDAASAFFDAEIDWFWSRQPSVIVRSVTPSPDNETVAMNITYQVCARDVYYNNACFGFSQIVLVSVATGQQELVFELDLHSDEYLPDAYSTIRDVQISDLLWLPDQQALVAAVSDSMIRNHSQHGQHMSIVVIPLTSDVPPFHLRKAVAWTVAPDSREMAVLSTNDGGLLDRLYLIDFDPITGAFSETDASQEPYVFWPDFGLGYLNNSLVFNIVYDTTLLEYEIFPDALGLLTPGLPARLSMVRPEIGGYRKIQASTTGNVAVIQNADGLLWKARIFDGILWVAPLTESPVTFWQFIKDDILVYQLLGSRQYRMADLSPNVP